MAHNTGNALQSLLDGATMYLARVYRITRQDGTVLRLTDHDSKIVVREGYLDGSSDPFSADETYTPAKGVIGSAVRQEAGLKESNIELEALISSDLITDDELRSGRYLDATVDIAYVDWRFPWLGLFRHNQFRLTDFKFDEERWMAQAVNKAGDLQRKIGRRWSRTCWNTFMDTNCGIAQTPGTTTFPAQEVSNVDPANPARFSFLAGPSYDGTTEVDDYFKAGHVRWTTGDNAGQTYPIYKSENNNPSAFDPYILELQFPTRAAISSGDKFDLFAGCERTIQACQSTTLAGKVDNHLRFGGAPHMPGVTRVSQAGANYRV